MFKSCLCLKGLFFAILFVTLLVNLLFLFATKEKPPDLSSVATLQSILTNNDLDYQQQQFKSEIRSHNNNTRSHTKTAQEEAKLGAIEDDDQFDKSNVGLGNNKRKSDNLRSQVAEHQKRSIVVRESERSDSNLSESRSGSQNDFANDAIINIEVSKTQIPTPTRDQNFKIDRKLNANSSKSPQLTDRTEPINSSQFEEKPRKKQASPSALMQMKLLANEALRKSPQMSAKSEATLRVEYRISEGSSNNNVIYSSSLDNDDRHVGPAIAADEYYLNTISRSHSRSKSINKNQNDNDGGRGRVEEIDGDRDRWLEIKVKSSRNHVFVSVDGGIIYESKSSVSQQKLQQIDAGRQAAHYLTRPAIINNKNQNNNMNDNNGHLHLTSNGEFMEDFEPEAGRGIHVIVLNQFNGNVMSKRLYDTYSHNQDKELNFFLSMIRDGRIMIFAIKDEGSFNMAPESPARKQLSQLGCNQITSLRWRDMWACVTRKATTLDREEEFIVRPELTRKGNYAEGLSKSPSFSDWGPPVLVSARIKLLDDPDPGMSKCHTSWQLTKNGNSSLAGRRDRQSELGRRLEFCSRTEGYGRVCDCSFPSAISFKPERIASSQIDQVPIIVIAGNRPYYLQRMLRSLLTANGVNPQMVTVFIDGFYEEPMLVSKLFDLRAIQHRPQGRRGARISHHYKSSLTRTFELFPQAEFAIIFEEDLDVAQDALLYFNQTMELLRNDESLYCVSAWNDQGYQHTVGDPRLLYRVETMPGLGWMLKRDLYKRELEPVWPSMERAHDWDMWIRMDSVRRGRECVIPDISRTYHFGSTGTNINAHFQSLYFSKHAINMAPLNPDGSEQFSNLDLMSPVQVYEKRVEKLIGDAEVINTNVNGTDYICQLAKTCERKQSDPKSAVIYIKMIESRDYRNWLKLANCWKIWDLDARGQHKSTWRLFLNGVQTFVVGYPASKYSSLKPSDVEPIDFASPQLNIN